MKYYWDRFKKPIVIAVELLLIFGIALLVVLYYFGYYDLSFLDRYRSQLDLLRDGEVAEAPADPFATLISSIEASQPADPEMTADPASSDAAADPEADPEDAAAAVPAQQTAAVKNVRGVYSSSVLPDARVKVSTAAQLMEAGYEFADPTAVYSPTRSVLGRLTFSFQLPEVYSTRYRVVKRWFREDVPEVDRFGTAHDYGNYQMVQKNAREQRPVIECYMGYLLIENEDRIVLCSSDGEPLCQFEPSRYAPAYVRDREGRPLFKRGGPDGTTLYFYLSQNGENFVASDYDPLLDDRGLHYDYPADWGEGDESERFIGRDEKTGLYAYLLPAPEPEPAETEAPEPDVPEDEPPKPDAPDTDEPAPDAPSEDDADKPEDGDEPETEAPETEAPETEAPPPEPIKFTEYLYTSAHPYREGLAAVTEKNNDGGLLFLDETGQRAFVNFLSYYNEFGRYNYYVYYPPNTDGVEQIGSFYYDEGLVRVRKRILDWFWYTQRASTRIVEEYDVLLRKDGTEYPLPTGYTLAGYSDGILLLEKDGRYGLYRNTGEWIAQPIYADAKPFIGGLAQLKTDDGRWGMIDTAGNIVLPFTYDSISQNSSGVIACFREETGWSVLRVMQ